MFAGTCFCGSLEKLQKFRARYYFKQINNNKNGLLLFLLRENLRFFNHGRISSVSILLDYRAEDHGFDFPCQTVRPILRVLTLGCTRRLRGFSEFFPRQ